MANIRDSSELGGLSDAEIGAIIGYLVQFNRRIDRVKDAFFRDWKRQISAETIKTISVKYDHQFVVKRLEFVEKPENRRLYHLADRLVVWEELLDVAMSSDNILEVVKIDRDSQDVIKGQDVPLAKEVLRNMAWDIYQYEKHVLDEKKLMGAVEEENDAEDSELGFNFKKMA